MATQNPNQRNSLYPEVIDSNPDAPSQVLNTNRSSSSQSNLYPSIDSNDLAQNLFPDDKIQWPLAKDETSVKLDDSHYFFSFRAHKGSDSDEEEEDRRKRDRFDSSDSDLLSYGLTIASKGQEGLLKELDVILKNCSSFSVQKVSEKAKKKGEALDGSMAKEVSPKDLESAKKKEIMEKGGGISN